MFNPTLVRLALVAALGVLASSPAWAAEHYVDCRDGNDGHTGRSPEAAWLSLEKVGATDFSPGDAILLKRGTRCTGPLWPKGSGEPGRPIRIGAYGEGPLPIVDGAGRESAVRLFNQQHWHIEDVEAVGGNPYGIHVSGDEGILRHLLIRNVVVHGVTGEVKTKASGLVVVAAGGGGQTFEDVTIDGVTAYDTTQWAGIFVNGAAKADKGVRARHVTIRNSIVHDVYGDGIVLFQVEDGLIERSAAWRTGLQPVETIGTPNGIWTWRCRRCTVEWTEGFFIDSPGVDGGVYDIDWGCDDGVVQYNFGHDAMGYCAAVFAANGEVTTHSTVRYNVCINNGRSPKLARRQGDVFLSTWDGGRFDGVGIYHNTFYWNPPIDVPLVQMDHADFTGRRPNEFRDNLVHSTVPRMVHSSDALRFDHNLYWYVGGRASKWDYAGRDYEGFEAYRRGSGQDAGGQNADPRLLATMRLRAGSPAIDAGTTTTEPGDHDAFGQAVPWGAGPDVGAVERVPAAPEESGPLFERFAGQWALVSDLGTDDLSRGQVVFLQSALEQYGEKGLVVAVAFPGETPGRLVHDWNLGGIRVLEPIPPGGETLPTTSLVAPDGRTVRRFTGLTPPAELGLLLRATVGPPLGSPGVDLPLDEASRDSSPGLEGGPRRR